RPLRRHGPVERRRTRRDLRQVKRHELADQPERLPNACAGQAAAKGKERAGERHHLLAQRRCVGQGSLDRTAYGARPYTVSWVVPPGKPVPFATPGGTNFAATPGVSRVPA